MQDRPGTLRETSYTPKLAGLDDIGSSLITLTVYLEQYRDNLRAVRDIAAPSKLICVVKANAYGFGVSGLLPILSEFDDISLGVANAVEAWDGVAGSAVGDGETGVAAVAVDVAVAGGGGGGPIATPST